MRGGGMTSGLLRLQLISLSAVFFFCTGLSTSPVPPNPAENPSLQNAFVALQAWKKVITRDPHNVTGSWVGADVCTYRGVFCSPPPDAKFETVVSGIDLNHARLAGVFPMELGLLIYIAIFHVNSNFFQGTIPSSFKCLTLLFELDVSNNMLSGSFPSVVLELPSIKYLDLRFNHFGGPLPGGLFTMPLDAIFVNDNNFYGIIPSNLGCSAVSVVNFANNHFHGAIPDSIGKMATTLNEILFINNKFSGCIPQPVASLNQLNVLDVGTNRLSGLLSDSLGLLRNLRILNVANNFFTGIIPISICSLPKLTNFTCTNNYFIKVSPPCLRLPSAGVIFNDVANCIPNQPLPRLLKQCLAFLLQPLSCRLTI
ncbi:hypothetical protein O6H91_22G053400 [Diphasiastrum complanatum]|uniref:Uncharacterized protein n=2 Tax=Diphasiastrum complanatum TaxID=34168 RepID=A0ACC2AFI2_DIPCM|nr:hypothetical protein O6H91_22G052600 [Diphasiastrum complanatum]KAJ7516320.1 hypothetical protein O6H91_22G053400 [Diphasiastrum complanatum]